VTSADRSNDAATRLELKLEYRKLAKEVAVRGIADVGFTVFLKTDEGGMLLYRFSLIGALNRTCAEVCAENGRKWY
jgi:hypothetical protein